MSEYWLFLTLALIHTGLGEEGAETLVGVGGLALRSEVAVGLVIRLARFRSGGGEQGLPGYRARGSRAKVVSTSDTNWSRTPRTSQQELAIWQPAWPTVGVMLASDQGAVS